jgi:hypothetical protein
MARLETDIIAAIDADIAANPDLSALDSSSAFAYRNLFRTIIAKAIRLHELLFDNFKADVDILAARAVPGTGPWYLERVKEFQYGDIVQILDDFTVGYSLLEPTKQIITKAAITKVDGDLAVKCRKLAGALTADEQTGLSAYLNKIKFAGTDIIIISINDDLLQITGNFYYDPEIALADIKADLDAQAEEYLANLEFNGLFYVSKLESILSLVLGYKDFELLTIQASSDSGSTYAPVERIYNPVSGIISYATSLSSQLTFIPNV